MNDTRQGIRHSGKGPNALLGCGYWWLLSLLFLLPALVLLSPTTPMAESIVFASANEDHTVYMPLILNGNGADPMLFQIVLIDDQGAWLIASNGSRKLRLTTDVQLADVADELSIHAAPGGQHVAVQRTDGWAIYENNGQSVADRIGAGFALAWEPDATTVLLSQLGHGIDRFTVANRQQITLLDTSDETNDHSPFWSEDRSLLAFAHHEFGTHLYVTLLPDFNEAQLPYMGENRDSGQFNEQFVVLDEMDSWHDQPITFHPANDRQSLIFAAGSTIHVRSLVDDQHVTIQPTGFGTRESGRSVDLYDDRILYFAGDGIYEVGLDGLTPRRIVEGDDLHYPQWGPNGEHIIYRGTDDQLYMVNADGTNNHVIPNTHSVLQFDLLK